MSSGQPIFLAAHPGSGTGAPTTKLVTQSSLATSISPPPRLSGIAAILNATQTAHLAPTNFAGGLETGPFRHPMAQPKHLSRKHSKF